MKKNKTKVVLMVVLAMLLQIIGPAVQSVYAEIANEPFSMTERPIGEDGIAQLDWEFTLDPNDRVEEYTYTGNFTLEKEVPETDLMAGNEEKTVIGNYKISTDGEVTVKINQELYDNLEDKEEETPTDSEKATETTEETETTDDTESTDTLPEEENGGLQEETVEGEGAETEDPEEDQHLQEGENPEGNEGESDGPEEGNDDEVTGEGSEEPTGTEANDENNEQADPENDDEVNEEEQEVSMLGKVVATLATAGEDILLTDDIDQEEEVTEEAKEVKFFTGTIKADGAKEKEDLFGRFVGLFSGPEELKNIFTSVKLLINGNEVGDDDDGIVNLDEITESMTIGLEFGWELPDKGSEFQLEKGDWASIQLPSVFKGVTGYMNGPLVDGSRIVGTYHISEEGMLKVIFGDHVEFDDGFLTETGRKGTVGFILDFVLDPFKDNSIQEIEFGDPINKTFIIKVKPGGTLASISKSGEPNKIPNADAIDWVIDVNTSLESLTNAMVKDSIPEGLELEGDIEIYHLKVGIDGSLNEGALKEKITSTDARNLEVTLGKIDTAYRIKYSTKITDYSKSGYTNIAELFDGEEKKGETSVTVNKVEQGAAISKRSLTPDRNATTIKWEIDVNKGEEVLKNVIVEDVLQENLTVNAGSIKIYELNKGESGWSKGADVTASFTTTSFPLSLGNLETADVYCIEFETDIEYMDYKETNTFQNKAILKAEKEVNGSPVLEQIGESTASATVYRDPIIIKEGKEITSYNSEYPVVEWTIKINGANHHIYDAVLTDTIGSGLRLITDSIEITPDSFQGGYPIYSYPTDNIMKIELGDITSSYTIKYKTEIRSIDTNTFKNKAELTGKGKHGVGVGEGEEPVEYDVKKDVTVPPSIVNNNYGKKAVSIDYSNKTMTWQIEIDAMKEALTELIITDTFEDKYMVFIEDGFSVTKGGTGLNSTSDYTLTNNNVDGFELILKETALGKGKYVITYKTSFNPNMIIANHGTPKTGGDNIYKNKVNLSGKTKNPVTNIDKNLNVNLTDEHILNQDIYNVGKKEGTLDREKKEITWRIYVNAQSRNLKGKDFVITDTIGEGHTFKAGSLSVHEFTLKPGGELSEEGINLGVKVTSGYELDADSNPFILKFSGGIDEAYLIEYTTEIEGITKPNYTNEAKITDNTGIEKTYPASVYYKDHNVFITKEALNAKGGRVFADDELNWKAVINESLSEIGGAVFSDTISAGHVYVDGSLKVYKGAIDADNLLEKDTFANADTNKYKLDVTSNSDETTTIKVGLGDINGRYIITYNTAVISSSGVITNTAKLTGTEIGDKSTGIKKFNITTTSWGTGSGVSELRGAIKIKKIDNASTPEPVADAEFRLYYKVNGTDTKWHEVDERFYTSADGTLTIGNLPKGRTYKLVEVKAPAGYRMSTEEADNTREITVVANTTTEATTSMVNERIRDITVKKVWIGPGKDGNGAGTATFKLLANGVEKKTITLTTETGWTHTFEGLDYYDSSGESIEYTVTEDSISGYQLLGGNPVKVVDPTLGNITYTFNNKNLEKVKVEVEKIWRKDESKPLPSSVTIKLLRDGIDTETTISLTASEWKGEFTELDRYDDEGRAYNYTIQEVPVSGFKTEIGSRQTISGGFKYIVTNIELMEIPVTKKWIGMPKGTSVTVNLYEKNADDSLKEDKVIQTLNITGTATEDAVWTGSFTNIPKYKADSDTPIQYGIKEVPVAGFETTVDGDNIGFTVTNMELVEVRVKKVWIGSGTTGITVKLFADGEDTGKSENLITENNKDYTFANLPKYKVDEHGTKTPIAYTVDEDLAGLTGTYEYEKHISAKTVTGSTINYTITNRNITKISIPVEKVWRVENLNDRTPVEIELKNNQNSDVKTIELNTDNDWSYTFTNLFKYDQINGNLITYSVEEKAIVGFNTVITGGQNDPNGIKVTNIELMDIAVEKKWLGDYNKDSEVEITLYEVEGEGRTKVADIKIKEASEEWKGTFTNIPKYKADSNDPIVYTILETPISGYETTIIGDVKDGFTVTNRKLISITGNKVWVNGPATKPTIELQLYKNGTKEGTSVELTNGTSHTWTDLYQTDEYGNAYTYTVDEVDVPANYNKTISGDMDSGFTIINTYESPKKDITATKEWIDGSSIRPDIWFKLYRKISTDSDYSEVEEAKIIKLSSGTLTATWVAQEENDRHGNLYTYLVKEVNESGNPSWKPDNYIKTENLLEVTNRYNSPTDASLKAIKAWDGGPLAKPTIWFKLYRTNDINTAPVEVSTSEVSDVIKELSDGITEVSWTGLTKTDEAGTEYIYSVKEVDKDGNPFVPENYKVSYKHNDTKTEQTVTNTYESPKIQITVEKVWENGSKPEVDIELYRDGIYQESIKLNGTESTPWTHIWEDLDKTDKDGKDYVYTVKEIPVANYTTRIDDSIPNRFIINNTYVIPKVNITGTKKWVGGSTNKPSVELQLYRDGVKYGEPVKLDGKEGTPWIHTWEDLDKTDIDGKEYKYTVDEVKVPNDYYKSISSDGLTVTNTYDPPYYPPEEPGPDPRPTNPPKEPEKPTEPEKETPETPEEPTEPTDPTDPEEPTNPPIDIEETTPKYTPKEGEVDVPEGSKPKVNNPPENGTVTIDKDGKWVYTPNPGFEGKDKFSIIITKPDGTEEEIFFEIDVQTPLGGVEGEEKEKEKEEKETPILPKTGQVDSILIYLAGLFFIVLGIVLRKRIV